MLVAYTYILDRSDNTKSGVYPVDSLDGAPSMTKTLLSVRVYGIALLPLRINGQVVKCIALIQ